MQFDQLKRRNFIALLCGAAAWPFAVRAQQPPMPVIGVLSPTSPDNNADRLRAFRAGLAERGFVEGQNVAIDFRSSEDRLDRLPAMAADFVRRQVTVIAVPGSAAVALAAKAATRTMARGYGARQPLAAGTSRRDRITHNRVELHPLPP